ncbi:hypothetical protein Acsp04_34800 [Actinomadura sp. NBRC 104425]|uniref:maleylpyruvate isomerase family mycothiol-dependent enzyme n=1 Tax=Actinomadura sp. NBRC 104425 TaxID=3032204 RepID=UPI0024A07C07|nr:maleylpyruvate isomerase family mycothiol-dependent enzyme [Actinomadura sp. NBRC 104425]GLZ13245.1 hypothetical protein Acsp04_34800 [Actinomadura sp. NBRC 104425]
MPLLETISFPYEDELRAERRRMVDTMADLSDEEFQSGRTLCSRWAPRDVLAHVIALDYLLASYLPYGPRINAANQAQVDRARPLSRDRLMEWAEQWAERPSTTGRAGAAFLLGDLGMHHQDVLRGLGRERTLPDTVATAVFREGLQLSLWLNRRVLRYRVVPTDGHRPVGRGPEVRGTREALGLWLAGRDSVKGDLEFA